MKVRLQLLQDGAPLVDEIRDVSDAESFGRAFAEAWSRLRQTQFEGETSVGALMDHLDESVLAQLDGAVIRLQKA